MDFNVIAKRIDQYYRDKDYDGVMNYMAEQSMLAMELGEDDVLLGILNEMIGYFRVTSQFELGNSVAQRSIQILENNGWQYTISAATTYLNIATMYRTEGMYEDALKLYKITEDIYKSSIEESDYRYNSFYNNISLLLQEMGDSDQALAYEYKALELLKKAGKKREQAITYANMALMYFQRDENDKAKKCVERSVYLFETYKPNDPHYFSALASLGHCYYLEGDNEKALEAYDKSLAIVEANYGKSKEYYTVLKNRQEVCYKGMDLCRDYFFAYKDQLLKGYEEYLPYLAFGLVGEGSDCLGYDDDISKDHDYGPAFCVWMPDDIYAIIGKGLEDNYNSLPKQFKGYKRDITPQAKGRTGVFTIDAFFLHFLKKYPETSEDWYTLDPQNLLNCTNGEIFEDHLGEVTRIRKSLQYYPGNIRRILLAQSVGKLSQAGQCNYARCKNRGEEVGASLALHIFIEEVMSTVYLLNNRYKPYYKWTHHGLKDCKLCDVKDLLEELVMLPNKKWEKEVLNVNHNDEKIVIIEKICSKIALELERQNLVNNCNQYLLLSCEDIIKGE